MADPRFFNRQGPFTLGEIAARVGASLSNPLDSDRRMLDVSPLDTAGGDHLSFLDNPRYLPTFEQSKAGACIVAAKHARRAPTGMALVISDRPYRAYALAAQLYYPVEPLVPAVHAGARVDPTARLGAGIVIGPGAVIEAGATIGRGTSIGANTIVGRNVVIGEECRIGPLVVLSHCEIGDQVTLHPGVKIGQDGFGFAPDPAGHVKVPQLGRVIIGSRCEIGANSTVDRGAGPDTVIGEGCWIDNLVQIGHNVTVGRGCIIVAQSGIAGSTRVGDFVALGAQGGLAGHLTVGSGAQIAAQSGVMHDIPAGETVCGSPAVPIKQYFRQTAILQRLGQKKGTQE